LSPTIEIRPVRDRRDLRRFIRLPWSIYRGNDCWVPPLLSERHRFLDRSRNPFFRHSEAELFLAERDGEVVGRIAASVYRRHLETYHDATGFFGFFESIDDRAVATALLDAAAGWLRGRGLRRMRGPASFTINDECGLLLDAFDQPPIVLMAYNPPYYPALLEGWGLVKAQDLLAYRITVPTAVPERLKWAADTLERRTGIVLRRVDLGHFEEEVNRLHKVHSAAWADNWGAVPLTREEVGEIARDLRPVVDPDFVWFAEKGGEPIGVCVTIPDLNRALKPLNGRLFPFGALRFLWEKRRIRVVRVLIMGVLQPYRQQGVDAAMYAKTMETGIRKGYEWGEMSWILESNLPMRRVLERLGAAVYKTYRMYDRDL